MEKVVVSGTKSEVIEAMVEKGYHMEGFNDLSIATGRFYAYKVDYQGADYFTIAESDGKYTLSQY